MASKYELKYGIKHGICGVYMIRNKITKDFYIGSSTDISGRLSTHFGRDARHYSKNPLYVAINTYPFDSFEFVILEECSPEDKIIREQFWYDKLHPTYNIVRPTENNFIYPEVQRKASINSNTPEQVAKRKELYHTEKYQKLFRKNTEYKMKSVNMILDNEIIKTFDCMRDAAKYITEITDYKGKNKVSKIKAVCDGERKTAFGYKWEYNKV